jgi:hypothetical protein
VERWRWNQAMARRSGARSDVNVLTYIYSDKVCTYVAMKGAEKIPHLTNI